MKMGLVALVVGVLIAGAWAQDAPAPTSASTGPANLTGILEKGGQFGTLIKLLRETQLTQQVTIQLNTSAEGLTVLAPTDNAFNNLKAGTLNDLSREKQVSLLLYHMLPKFYTFDSLLTLPNPVRTQYSDATLNLTSQSRQLNVSSGLVTTQLNNPLRETYPLSVFQLDAVLLPEALFVEKPPPPTSAPPPATKGSGADDDDKTNSKADSPSANASSHISPVMPFLLAILVGLLVSF